ncbi:sugar ABC transporter substrate-binding protein [Euzebya tangerina]|uniref:sugar ABC transporter substrate-binding protein n=1 Tax=Euzebya tangerina TaxID=591198 RepID=UPI000E30EB57|nr:maltose ABC transporter substrate-binding protein [Euzebya tangerina]
MRTRTLAALLLVLALFAGACSGGDTEDSTDDADTGAEATEESAAEDEGTEDAEADGEAMDEEATEAEATEAEAAEEEAAPEEEATEAVVRADADLVIWADDTRVDALQPFVDQFGEENGITVALQELAFDEIRDQFSTAGPAGEGPDIIVGAHDWLGQLVTNGLVAPVDLANPDDYADVAIEAMTYEGQLYGVPYAIENIALVRNTDLVPEVPATFEELEQTALELQESGEVEIGLALQADPADPFHNYPLFTSTGASVFGINDDGTYNPDELGIDSPEALESAQKFGEWVESGLINPSVTYDVMVESFASGNAAFAITGPWAVSQEDPPGFRAQGVNYEITPIPPVDGGTPAPFVGVQGLMISSFSEQGLLAQTFVQDFIGTEEVQLALFENGGRPPALLSAFEQVSDDPDVQGFGEAGQNGQPLPAIPEMGSVWTAWTDAYELIYDQEGTPTENFEAAAAQIRNLIAEG